MFGTVPTLYYTKGEALPSKHEGATLRKYAKILCGFKTQK
jgi:hypothetical protein